MIKRGSFVEELLEEFAFFDYCVFIFIFWRRHQFKNVTALLFIERDNRRTEAGSDRRDANPRTSRRTPAGLLQNPEIFGSSARLLVVAAARGGGEGRRAVAALEGPLVGVLVHVLEQVPLGGEAARRNADLALVRLQVVRGVHRQDVEPGRDGKILQL